MLRRTIFLAFATILAFSTLFTPASYAEEDNAYVEVFLGQIYFETDFDLDETTYGVRGGYRFSELWGIEGGISQQEINNFVDTYFVDISLRRSLLRRERSELFFVGGPGLFRAEVGNFPFSDTQDELALHAGFGFDIQLGERFYLRPDLRARWVDGNLFDNDIHTEATLGFGFKF